MHNQKTEDDQGQKRYVYSDGESCVESESVAWLGMQEEAVAMIKARVTSNILYRSRRFQTGKYH